jgi:elongation factor G
MAANGNHATRAAGPRCIALVGPFQSGKTTLLEAILARTGAVARQGNVEAGNTVGDSSAEARHHRMSVELTVATTTFMGDNYTFLDCPGSVEFVHDMRAALPAVDAAVVVCELDEKKIPQLQLILRGLEEQKIPRLLFLNKIDKANAAVHDVLNLLQSASRTKLVLRQIPTFSSDIVTGFVDLALERAFVYKEHAASEVVALDGAAADREKTARFSMLETLADHDDELMEQLLEDIQPPRDKVFDDLTRELREGLVCPVLMGTAIRANGVLRLLKAVRHESPGIAETAKRLGVKTAGTDAVAYVLKTENTTHGGKMSIVRMLAGQAGDGTTFASGDDEAGRVAGVFRLIGQSTEKRGPAAVGETVAFAKLDKAKTGDTLSTGKQAHPPVAKVEPYPPVLAVAISAKERKDDVKLGQALNKLAEEDPSIVIVHDP